MSYKIREGNYNYLGVEKTQAGFTFTFEAEANKNASLVFLDSQFNKISEIKIPPTYSIGNWRSVLVENLDIADLNYYYIIDGQKFIDPYATRIVGRDKWNDSSRSKNKFSIAASYEEDSFDWGEDVRPALSKDELCIYKLNVRSFTMDQKGSKKNAGSFVAVKDKIEYIKDLGFTAIELLPVYEFEEIITDEKNKPQNVNMWGYTRGNYFSVKASYGSDSLKASEEYKALIKEAHANKLEVIMEIIFEHGTSAGYLLDVLKFWVKKYHVDGIHIIGDELPMEAVYGDSFLSGTKIFYKQIDEYWTNKRGADTLFAYNNEYSDVAKSLLNHFDSGVRAFVNQQRKQGNNLGFVNYFANIDGFTLADLFMYNDRHNEENGENNRDGSDYNLSNNYGIEGPSRKKYIKKIRDMKWKNAIIMLLTGQAVPMLVAGDEMDNSQQGNNNAYCQDNKTGWVNWKSDKASRDKTDFIKFIMKFRQEHSIVSMARPYKFGPYGKASYPDASYHSYDPWISEHDLDRECIGIMYSGEYTKDTDKKEFVYIGYNFFSGRNLLALPELPPKKKWYLICDTSKENDWYEKKAICLENQEMLQMEPQAISILVGR